MKFHLVDRIESIEPGKSIVTTKALSLAEEYLADHFPAFPIMPGVLMLESLAQAGAWLVRVHQDFAKSIIVLASAQNVRYSNFVQPGQALRCKLEAIEINDGEATFKARGFVDDVIDPKDTRKIINRSLDALDNKWKTAYASQPWRKYSNINL